MKKIITSLLFTLLLTTSYAQDKSWTTGDRATLEEWVFDEQGLGRYVGISDPGLDSLTAYKQALARAWFLAVADSGLEIRMLQESFNRVYGEVDNEDLAYKYNYIAQIAADSFSDIYLNVDRQYTSIFGERFVEVYTTGFPSASSIKFSADSAKISGECYVSGTEVYKLETDMRLRLGLEVTIDGEFFQESIDILRVNKQRSSIHVVQGDTTSTRHRGKYYYNLSDMNIGAYLNEGLYPEPTSIEDGIFTAMIETMVGDILSAPHYSFEVKRVSEDYNSANKELMRMGYIGVIRLYHIKHIVNSRNIWGKWQVYDGTAEL
ncbi:MAG: hypothetical protein R3Y49_02530 [Rikenellaceae bacterium]